MIRKFLPLAIIVICGCTRIEEPAVAPPMLERPNILWVSVEDMGPRLGAYGDATARTPNVDELASKGTRFTRAFTTAGVCSPSRAAIITGMHQVSIGAHHMRTLSGAPFAPPPTPYSVVPPHYVKTFTEYLRAAGYYTTNNGKEDYQFETPVTAWDATSDSAHWRNRPDPEQPFFSVFNLMVTHESRIWPDMGQAYHAMGLGPSPANPSNRTLVTDLEDVTVPPYYPDTPAVRRDIAQHYDNIAVMDSLAGGILSQLEEDGLADNTIVFFWSDHGDGLPRHKRWLYDSGLHVPLIIHTPGQIAGVDDQLVSFLDLAPTVLSLAGVEPPTHMQGRALLGSFTGNRPPREYVFAARDRVDEQYDMVRSVRGTRYKYIRNYRPEKPYVLWMAYANAMPTMQELFRLHAEGTLNTTQELWMQDRRPVHELYDVDADPFEVQNLAYDPAHAPQLATMQEALDHWMRSNNDYGMMNEQAMVEKMWPDGIQPVTEPPAIFPRAMKQTALRDNDNLIDTSISGGAFEQGVEITMYSPTQGASITYSTDEDQWLLYSHPIVVDSTTTLRAKAIRYGYQESSEVAATFVIESP